MSDREALLKAVAECWPYGGDASNPAGVVGGIALLNHPNGRERVMLTLSEDTKDAAACFLMLDAMFSRDCYGFGPPVVVELTGGSPTDWYCRRVVCPDSDAPFTTHEGQGATKAEAIARAFVACFGKAAQAGEVKEG